MPISAQAAAKRLGELRGWKLSNLEIQKLLYIAHMISLGRSEGARPLINEPFEAWDYGPVVPSLYHSLKMFGAKPVWDVFYWTPDIEGTPEAEIIDEVANKLSGKGPAALVAMTHRNGGAWANHYRPGAKGITIPNDDILGEYRAFTKRSRAA